MTSFSAPGKLFLFGEYAVLRGAPAIVTAVDRRVVVRRRPGPYAVDFGAAGGVVDLALPTAVADACGTTIDDLEVDLSDMFDGSQKLGLGSSAASAVALTAAMLETDEVARVLPVALEAHRRYQGGQGSGADVIVAAMGGTQCIRRDAETAALEWPDDLLVYAVWMGQSASTTFFVRAVLAGNTDVQLTALAGLAGAAVEAFRARDAAAIVSITRAWDETIEALADACGAEIRIDAHRRLAEAVAPLGAAAKPSGAGGGDITLIVARSPIDPSLWPTLLPQGCALLDLALHRRGLSHDEQQG